MFLNSTIFRINETIMVLASSVELKKFYSITYLDYPKKTKIKFTLSTKIRLLGFQLSVKEQILLKHLIM